MTEHADAVELGAIIARAIGLVEHGKTVDSHTIAVACPRAVAIVFPGAERPLAWPHRLAHTGLSLAHTGIDHDAHIGLAIAIVVILAPVDGISGLVDGVTHHQGHAAVIAVRVVAAIGGAGTGQVEDAIDVKLWGIFSVALVGEIPQHTLVIGLVVSLKLLNGVDHLLVGVLHQDDGHTRAAAGGHLGLTDLAGGAGCGATSASMRALETLETDVGLLRGDEAQLGSCTVDLVMGHDRSDTLWREVVEVALVVHVDRKAVLGDKHVEELVTHHLHGDARAIGLSERTEARLGRNGMQGSPHSQHSQH